MATQFDVFDVFPYEIRLINGSEGGYYDSDSVWVNAATTSTAITGHFTLPNREEDETEYTDRGVGLLEEGDLDFYTETPLELDDILEVDQNATPGDSVRKYRILAVTKVHNIMAHYTNKPPRTQAHIREVPLGD